MALLAIIAVALFALRLTEQPNLLDNEYRVGACVLNALQGGNWVSPHDSLGNMSKPPMLTWLSALASLPNGHVSRFTLYVPTAGATLVIAWLVFLTGRRHFGQSAGFLGALAYLLSYVASQQMGTARWDGLFALTVMLTALACFRAWTMGRGWTLFWLAAAVATLTKGPLGVILASLGLLAMAWERRSGHAFPLRGTQAPGIALFLLITLGWLLAAFLRSGPHLLDNLLGTELVGHVLRGAPAHRFFKPLANFLGGFAPWSVVSVYGLWRVWSSPAADDLTRRFERFCFWWLIGGLLVFCVSPHNPSRLLYPLIPPAAILAGRELDRFVQRVSRRSLVIGGALAIVLTLTVLTLQHHRFERRSGKTRKTVAMLALSRDVRAQVGEDFPLTYMIDVPYAAQLTLNTVRPPVSARQAAGLLRNEVPAYVVVKDLTRLQHALGHHRPPLFEVASSAIDGVPYLRILSNRPKLEWAQSLAIGLGSLRVKLHDVRLGPTQDGEIVVLRGSKSGSVAVTNYGKDSTSVTIRLTGGGHPDIELRTLAPNETYEVSIE